MITTTFKLARDNGACPESYKSFAKHVGGIKSYGENKPIPLTTIADVCGLQDALWCLMCTQQPDETERLARLLAADFAEHVLPIFEKQCPRDERPRKAIEAARLYAEGRIGAAARAAAGDAARATAWATARAAAGDAAWAAAWAAAGDAAGDAAWAAARAAARDAAGDAARDAAGDAARATARATAWAAAGDAEQEWQLNRFKEVLST